MTIFRFTWALAHMLPSILQENHSMQECPLSLLLFLSVLSHQLHCITKT